MLDKLLEQLKNELKNFAREENGESKQNLQDFFVSPWRPSGQQLLKKLIAHLEKYQAMMAEDIQEQNRVEINKDLLAINPVFSSERTPFQVRQSIKTRRLHYDPELFEKIYNEILTTGEPGPQGHNAIAVINAYDLVPQRIPAIMILESGLKEAYLLKKCQEHGITLRKLDDLLFLRKEYKTGFYKLVELCDQGFSVKDIELFMSVREAVDFSVSINKIIEFWQCFGQPDDPGCMAHAIMRISEEFDIYPSQAVKRMIKTARELEQFEIEGVLDFIFIDEAEVSHALNDD